MQVYDIVFPFTPVARHTSWTKLHANVSDEEKSWNAESSIAISGIGQAQSSIGIAIGEKSIIIS